MLAVGLHAMSRHGLVRYGRLCYIASPGDAVVRIDRVALRAVLLEVLLAL